MCAGDGKSEQEAVAQEVAYRARWKEINRMHARSAVIGEAASLLMRQGELDLVERNDLEGLRRTLVEVLADIEARLSAPSKNAPRARNRANRRKGRTGAKGQKGGKR